MRLLLIRLNIMNKKCFLSLFMFFCVSLLTSFTVKADYAMYANRISSTEDGKSIIDNYYKNYSFDLEDRFIEYTYRSIDVYLAGKLREITQNMYAIVLNKIYSDVAYYSNLPQRSEAMQVLQECINVNAGYMTIEQRCVPANLWNEGYYRYAECAAAEIRQAIDFCLTGSP